MTVSHYNASDSDNEPNGEEPECQPFCPWKRRAESSSLGTRWELLPGGGPAGPTAYRNWLPASVSLRGAVVGGRELVRGGRLRLGAGARPGDESTNNGGDAQDLDNVRGSREPGEELDKSNAEYQCGDDGGGDYPSPTDRCVHVLDYA